MLLVLQIAVGVCAGLWLFRWFATRQPWRAPPSVGGAIRFCAIVITVLWVLHLVFTVAYPS